METGGRQPANAENLGKNAGRDQGKNVRRNLRSRRNGTLHACRPKNRGRRRTIQFRRLLSPTSRNTFDSPSVPLGDYFITTGADITSLKKSEQSLRQSREDLDRAQAVGQIGSWRLDVRRNVLTWSDENHRIFGVPKGTPLTYETFLGIIHPDDRQYVDTQWKAGLRGEPYDIEHRIVVDGQVKWVREKAYLEFDEAGKLLGGFGITQDITERKRPRKYCNHSSTLLQRSFRHVCRRIAREG